MQARLMTTIRTVAMVLALAGGAAMAQPALEQEQVHPSEVVFEKGQPFTFVDGGYQPLRTRVQNGETIYYRMVRYDAQLGYLDNDGAPAALSSSTSTGFGSEPLTPLRYDGAGLSRPDFHNSPYNRDARQRFYGPGYFGSCSRYDGCRGVEYVPLIPYLPRD